MAIPADYKANAVTIADGYVPTTWLKKHEKKSCVKFHDWVIGICVIIFIM